MQALVDLDNVLGNLSQFIFGESLKHICIYRLVAVGFHGKLLKISDRHPQPVGDPVEEKGQYQTDGYGKPDIVGVGLQILA